LEVTEARYDSNNYLYISGTMEANGYVSIFLDSGHSLSADANEDGSWLARSDEPIDYTDNQLGYAYAVFNDIQYDTVVFTIPPANN